MRYNLIALILVLAVTGCARMSTPDRNDYKINELIVEFHKGVSKAEIYEIAKRNNISYVKFLNRKPKNGYIVLMGSHLPAALLKRALRSEPAIKLVEFNYKRKFLKGK